MNVILTILLPTGCSESYTKFNPATCGNCPATFGASFIPCSRTSFICCPVKYLVTIKFPKGKTDIISPLVIFPAAILALIPPPLVMAISAPAVFNIASAIKLPRFVSPALTCSLTPSSSVTVLPII